MAVERCIFTAPASRRVGSRQVNDSRRARDVEGIRRGARRRVSIGPREEQHHGLTGGHVNAGHLGGSASRTSRDLDRRVVAEHLFDHRRRSVGISDQQLPLVLLHPGGVGANASLRQIPPTTFAPPPPSPTGRTDRRCWCSSRQSARSGIWPDDLSGGPGEQAISASGSETRGRAAAADRVGPATVRSGRRCAPGRGLSGSGRRRTAPIRAAARDRWTVAG